MSDEIVKSLVDSYNFPEQEKVDVLRLIDKLKICKNAYYDAWVYGVQVIIANMILKTKDESFLVRFAARKVLNNALQADELALMAEVITNYEKWQQKTIIIENSIMKQVQEILNPNNKAA